MTTKRNMFLTTSDSSVALVLLEVVDVPLLLQWFNDHSITQYLGQGEWPKSQAFEEEWVKSLYDKPGQKLTLGIWNQTTNKLIGTVGLHNIDQTNQSATLGIAIGDSTFHSKGFGRQAIRLICEHGFNRLNLRHITLRVLGHNQRAIKCYQKLGFSEVGRYPTHIFKEGAWHDDIYMLLTRSGFLVGDDVVAIRVGRFTLLEPAIAAE